jgi:hypothetical protein
MLQRESIIDEIIILSSPGASMATSSFAHIFLEFRRNFVQGVMPRAVPAKTIHDLGEDDDDSSDDSDYHPEENPVDDDDEDDQPQQAALEEIPIGRKRKVYDIFSQLVEEDHMVYQSNKAGLAFKQLEPSLQIRVKKSSDQSKNKSKDKNLAVLSQIFGKTEALQLMNLSSNNDILQSNSRSKQADSSSSGTVMRVEKEKLDEIVRSTIKQAIQNVKKKQKVVETRKFAGQEVR